MNPVYGTNILGSHLDPCKACTIQGQWSLHLVLGASTLVPLLLSELSQLLLSELTCLTHLKHLWSTILLHNLQDLADLSLALIKKFSCCFLPKVDNGDSLSSRFFWCKAYFDLSQVMPEHLFNFCLLYTSRCV